MTTATTTSVTTLKQLQKECKTIDLAKIHIEGNPNQTFEGYPYHPGLSTKRDDKTPYIKFGKGGRRMRKTTHEYTFKNDSSGLWDWIDVCHPKVHELDVYMFQGGKSGNQGYIHYKWSNLGILVESDDKILGVRYALDNDYLNDWVRKTIDPKIPNNYDHLHSDKEFEVLITTTTFFQEKVKVVGRTYGECFETMKQNDPMLNTSGQYSGMRTIPHREGIKPIPSSYEEWVSLQEKEGA